MYSQLGTTIFDGLFSFHEYERKVKKEFAQLQIINAKPDLQDVGTALEVIDLAIRLHESFCIPDLRYEELRSYCDNGDILPFIDGRGNIIGNFVIEDLSQAVFQTDTLGAVTLCECKAVLREYVDPNRALSRAIAAKRTAFALNIRSLTINSAGPISAPSVDIFNSMQPLTTNANAAIAQVNKANQTASTQASFVEQAIKSVNQVVASAQSVQSKVEDYAAQGFSVETAFMDGNTAVITNAHNLLANLRSGNLAAAATDAAVLGQSVNQLNTAALPIQKLLILR